MDGQGNCTGIYFTRNGITREICIELLDDDMVEVYRSMTVAERLAAGFSGPEFVRERVRAHLRCRHPEWSDTEIEAAVAEKMRGYAG